MPSRASSVTTGFPESAKRRETEITPLISSNVQDMSYVNVMPKSKKTLAKKIQYKMSCGA